MSKLAWNDPLKMAMAEEAYFGGSAGGCSGSCAGCQTGMGCIEEPPAFGDWTDDALARLSKSRTGAEAGRALTLNMPARRTQAVLAASGLPWNFDQPAPPPPVDNYYNDSDDFGGRISDAWHGAVGAVKRWAAPPPKVHFGMPKFRGGRWNLPVQFRIKNQPVIITFTASPEMVKRAKAHLGRYVEFGGDLQEKFLVIPPMTPEFGGIWEVFDDVANAIGSIASNPVVAGVVSAIPYGAAVVAGVNAAVGTYKGVRAATAEKKGPHRVWAMMKKQSERIKRIQAEAAKGNPQAIEAKEQLNSVAAADKLRRAAAAGNPQALKRIKKIRLAALKGDPKAAEAFLILDQLQKQIPLNPAEPAQRPAPHPMKVEQEPIEVDYDFDMEGGLPTEEELVDVIGARIVKKKLNRLLPAQVLQAGKRGRAGRMPSGAASQAIRMVLKQHGLKIQAARLARIAQAGNPLDRMAGWY
jgi:hypothetical protein